MTFGDLLAVVAVVFLAGHLLTDMRALRRVVRFGKDGEHQADAVWTVLTVVFLIGHIILDWV